MSWIQGVHPEKKFAELEWTHEMYVLGHMVQAAVALDRANGRHDLLDIARASSTWSTAASDRAATTASAGTRRSRPPSSSCTATPASSGTSRSPCG